MPTLPKFEGPDAVLREDYTFSTTIDSRHFSGEMDADTVDMQVSVRGAAFTSDPDLIAFEGTTFVVPNPSAFPDGIQLLAGDNDIQVKAVFSNGTVSKPSRITARLVQDSDLGVSLDEPTGVFLERFNEAIKVTVDGLDASEVIGYNFYASTQPGGGAEGYSRINPSLVISGEQIEDLTTLAELTVDANVATLNDGSPAADPLFMVYKATQEDQDDTVLQTDFDQALEIPDNTTRVRSTISVEAVRSLSRYSFVHDRLASFNSPTNPAIPNAAFNAIPKSDPVYYVVTAVYFTEGTEYETAFSPELSGSPLELVPNVGTFPAVSRQNIVRDTVLSIFRAQPQIDVKPGSVLRDTFIDPFSTEAERQRFIIDFLHRAGSFATLLPIDDPSLSGVSIPVEQSDYKIALKQAFFLESTSSVQQLIDNTFEKLASNYGKTRRSGRRARGSVTIYTRSRPTTSLSFGIGTRVVLGGVGYRLTSSVSITSSGAGSFFNPITGRYSATAFVQAEDVGLGSNLAPGQNGTVSGAPVGVEVTNDSAISGGLTEESNRDLAARGMNALSSVDSGTLRGYVKNAVDVPGVEQVNVVDAGHPLMQRDRNESGRHVGGKVDIWLRGENLSTVTDSFAFSFESKTGVQFEPVGDPKDLRLRAVDPSLSEDNPIIEMLDYPEFDIELVNETKGATFDLTNTTVVAYNVIQLDTALNDPAILGLLDVVKGSYRYRTSNKHTFARQPVRSVGDMTGEVSGELDEDIFDLYQASDPLELGRSTEAGDYVQVTEPLTDAGDTIPSGTPIEVTGEQHVILDGVEYVNRLGANPYSVVVTDETGATTYVGPFASLTPEYTIITGDSATPLGIQVTSGSPISEGQTLLISYKYDENFTVLYTTNALVSLTESAINPDRHITADVVAKEAVNVPVDLTVTVVLENANQRRVSVDTVDGAIRTALDRYFGALVLGEPVRQADVLGVIENVSGVAYPVVPLTKMSKGDGALVVREFITTTQSSDVFAVDTWNATSGAVNVWLLKNPLEASTIDSGGEETKFRGVFADEDLLENKVIAPNINGVPMLNGSGSAFIIGAQGLEIPGFSDDATLQAAYPFASGAEIIEKRREITANRILVSLTKDDTPLDHQYTVTYQVQGDAGVKNIEPGPTEYLEIGEIDLTFDEDTDFLARVQGRN
jgi:uncharacterized phage protein gp47/JayE